MSISIRNIGLASPAAIAIAFGTTLFPVQAETLITQSIPKNLDLVAPLDNYNQDLPEDPFNQVTNVNQLRDVSPTDWTFEALRSLVDRYGCIVGFPDQTYRGHKALSRYEFAAGLNACLNQIERLIASSETVLREDLETINRLMQEFEAELASVKGRVDNLESRTAFLEDHQFSATTKLSGSVVFALADVFGGDGGKNQTVFQERTTLTLGTSFTGKDILLTSLWQGNAPLMLVLIKRALRWELLMFRVQKVHFPPNLALILMEMSGYYSCPINFL